MEEAEGERELIKAAVEDIFAKHLKLQGLVPLELFLFGSHLHGCASPSSDWDFVAVVDAPCYFSGIRRVAVGDVQKIND